DEACSVDEHELEHDRQKRMGPGTQVEIAGPFSYCLIRVHPRQKEKPRPKPGFFTNEACAAYLADISAMVVSSMRLEKPHSLSYQEQTFTRVPPMTWVRVASYTDLCGSWLKSTETSGLVL